jgi:hypothetical protein
VSPRASPGARSHRLRADPRTVQPTPVIPIRSSQERLRFAAFSFARTPSGQCSAEVTLELLGKLYIGRAIGPSSPQGDLRVSAEACLRALEDYNVEAREFELFGVKQTRAFDANIAIVCITRRTGRGTSRLVGCFVTEDDVNRGAAVAVLNATNRVFVIQGTQRG